MVFFISHNLFFFLQACPCSHKDEVRRDHNSVYFIFKGLLVFFSVFFNPVSTHINLANYLISNGIVKCYDVCVGVMIKKFFVDFKKIVVIAKTNVMSPISRDSCGLDLMQAATADSVFSENVPTE